MPEGADPASRRGAASVVSRIGRCAYVHGAGIHDRWRMGMSARLLLDAKCDLGEGPLWSARDQAIYWTDIKVKKLRRYRLADGAVQSWDMPQTIGWAFERLDNPGF